MMNYEYKVDSVISSAFESIEHKIEESINKFKKLGYEYVNHSTSLGGIHTLRYVTTLVYRREVKEEKKPAEQYQEY